jgi:predicted transcriptional regulator
MSIAGDYKQQIIVELDAEVERLKADLKETVSLKYHDDLMHEWKVSEVQSRATTERLTAEVARLKHRENYLFDCSQQNTELQARVDELESALRGYVKATTGQESAIVTFPMALEGEVK